MDILIWIFIAGVVFVISTMRKLYSTAPPPDDELSGEIVDEAFPVFEALAPQTTTRKKKKRKVIAEPSNTVALRSAVVDEKTDKPQREQKTDAQERVAIKTKSEAKRAIIYAEIFNRKYF